MDTFQDSSQLLMLWTFTEASQAIHRRDKFGHGTGTWFNQLIQSTIWFFVRSTNTYLSSLTSNLALTRFITACRVDVYAKEKKEEGKKRKKRGKKEKNSEFSRGWIIFYATEH
jgi:hypothetical protein